MPTPHTDRADHMIILHSAAASNQARLEIAVPIRSIKRVIESAAGGSSLQSDEKTMHIAESPVQVAQLVNDMLDNREGENTLFGLRLRLQRALGTPEALATVQRVVERADVQTQCSDEALAHAIIRELIGNFASSYRPTSAPSSPE